MERTELARETANKLSKLLISRRDAKAYEKKGEWFAKRQAMTIDDFESHLYGEKCMGTYLLNKKSQVKFIAFDVDLTGPGAYFIIRDLDEAEEMEANGEYSGELDPDYKYGRWDVMLHDPESDGYRWVRSALMGVVRSIEEHVRNVLDLPTLPVVTGGGAHVIVPFGELVSASDARAAAHTVMDGLPGFRRLSENFYTNTEEGTPLDDETRRPLGETLSIEVFPKQDQLSDSSSLGNLIRLPFGWHHKAGIRTYVLNTSPSLPPWGLPKKPSVVALDDVMDCLRLSANV